MNPTRPVVEIGVGIDIARYRHVVQFIDANKRPLRQKLVIDENRQGYDRLAKTFDDLARRHRDPLFRCVIDDASVYGRNLRTFLQTLPHKVVITAANPLLNRYYKKAFLKDNKNDELDAQFVARFAVSERPAASPPIDPDIELLKTLCSRLASQKRQTLRISNQMHQLLATCFPEFAKLFKKISCPTARALLRKYPTAEKAAKASAARLARFRVAKRARPLGQKKAQAFVRAASKSVASLTGPAVEQALLGLLDQLELSIKAEADLSQTIATVYKERRPNELASIRCVGYYSSGVYTAFIGDVRRFESADKLVGYFGPYPVEDQSGEHRGRKVMSRKGNDLVRQVLFMNCLSGIKTNPILKELYKRKIAEGKSRMVAIGHCMRKLLHIIYAVLTKNEPFDPHPRRSRKRSEAPSDEPARRFDSAPAQTRPNSSDEATSATTSATEAAAPRKDQKHGRLAVRETATQKSQRTEKARSESPPKAQTARRRTDEKRAEPVARQAPTRELTPTAGSGEPSPKPVVAADAPARASAPSYAPGTAQRVPFPPTHAGGGTFVRSKKLSDSQAAAGSDDDAPPPSEDRLPDDASRTASRHPRVARKSQRPKTRRSKRKSQA